MVIIGVKKLIKTFHTGDLDVEVLKGIDLSINKGEFVSIVGRSGAGKSTLMYQMSLLDNPTEGKIILEKQNTSEFTNGERVSYRLRKLGFVFQDYAILPELTARQNAALPSLMQGMGKREAYRLADEALTKMGLGERLNNLPSQLSGGEQQRVSIARAIAHKPAILFADEPTASLDRETALKILDLFIDLHREGQTIVMVTHEPKEINPSERIVTLDDGLVKSDRPHRGRKNSSVKKKKS